MSYGFRMVNAIVIDSAFFQKLRFWSLLLLLLMDF